MSAPSHEAPHGPRLSEGRIPWRQRLGVRLTVAIAALTLLTLAVVALVTIRQQRAQVIAELHKDAAFFSETIRNSTHEQMLQNRKEETYRLMERIGHQTGVERVRIFNRDGKVTFSTAPDETGRVFELGNQPCVTCHATGQPLALPNIDARYRIDRGADGHGVLSVITPIYSEPNCATGGCHQHGPQTSMLGVVDVGLSLREADLDVQSRARQTALFAAVLVVLVSLLVFALSRRYVLSPINDLVVGTRRVAVGEFGPEIPVRRRDELGHLAESFNEMRAALVRMYRERQALLEGLERQVEERTSALRAAQESLIQTEKLASLGKLSASIAHEINNPLAGILTFSKLIAGALASGTPDENVQALCLKQVKLIQRETERCSTIVKNLLDFARERRLDLVPLDVNAPLLEALSLVMPKITQQDVKVVKELGAGLTVTGDFGQLRQAFLNIVINACDAMPKGGTLTVATRRRTLRDEIEVVVSDTGAGIKAADLSKIFDPFFTTKETGTGLGLSVVYGIADKHGGRLEVQSAVGSGTTMCLVLPPVRVDAEPAPP